MSVARVPAAHRRRGVRAFGRALAAALQWKLLLLWLLATLLPTVLAVMPLRIALQNQFGDSLYAPGIAAGRDTALLIEGLMKIGRQMGVIGNGTISAALLMLLLSPWLTGMIVASLRAGRRLGFGDLVHGGLREYWRMLRMLLWSAIPLGIALWIASSVLDTARGVAVDAILASQVDNATHAALAFAGVLFVLAHAGVEAGRGWLGADPGLRSVVRAWRRGCRLLLRRPLATLGVYLGTCLVGLGLALGLAWLRVLADGVGIGAAMLSFLLVQAMAASLAWGRIARLYALADLAADAIARQDAIRTESVDEPRHLPPRESALA